MSSSKVINWNDSANDYSKLGSKISFYKETANKIAEMSCIYPHQTIVDLGCGSSGFLMNKLLKCCNNLQKLYCIDSSEEMINVLARKVISPKVDLIISDAENFNNYLDTKVDIVISNSAFWMFDMNKTLIAVRDSLKNSGRFIFNIAEFDYEFEDSHSDAKYEVINRQLEMRKLVASNIMRKKDKLNRSVILNLIDSTGFLLRKETFVDTKVTAKDWEYFYQIPTIASKCLPNIPLITSQEVLKNAMRDLHKKPLPPLRWIFFEIIKKP
jgi:ubiquinone/menaquinone biosynthesis C-methylase UbiE